MMQVIQAILLLMIGGTVVLVYSGNLWTSGALTTMAGIAVGIVGVLIAARYALEGRVGFRVGLNVLSVFCVVVLIPGLVWWFVPAPLSLKVFVVGGWVSLLPIGFAARAVWQAFPAWHRFVPTYEQIEKPGAVLGALWFIYCFVITLGTEDNPLFLFIKWPTLGVLLLSLSTFILAPPFVLGWQMAELLPPRADEARVADPEQLKQAGIIDER